MICQAESNHLRQQTLLLIEMHGTRRSPSWDYLYIKYELSPHPYGRENFKSYTFAQIINSLNAHEGTRIYGSIAWAATPLLIFTNASVLRKQPDL